MGRKIVVFILGVLTVTCGSGTSSFAPPPPRGEAELNVLFIGNSLTYINDLPGMTAALLDSAGVGPVRVASVALPNFGLQDHWARGEAQSAIRSGGWDVVILQQGPSATEGRPSLLEYGERYATLIRENDAEPAFYMVYPSIFRFDDFPGVIQSYTDAARLVDGILYPVGLAWLIAWEQDPELQLYSGDGLHPSFLGTYIAALVIVEALSGRSARDLPSMFRTAGANRLIRIDQWGARIARRAASEANARVGAASSP